ncbi:hypothetical protein ACDP63_17325 [Paracoccus sp. P2]|uniref:hypothetical protein n=1 Tax=Paracoccus sp. P2 TaxID=3248840 RepID=UPI00391F3EC6
MMVSTNIQGRSVDSVSSENATISLAGNQDGAQGFFLLDHNLGTVKAVLFLVRDQPFKLQVNSSGPRGFMAWLEIADNAGQGTEITSRIVNIAHNFDPSRLDISGNILLDRWQDGDRALVPVSREKVRFNDGVSPDLRKILTLKIAPLSEFEAGGVRWSSDRPWCDAQRFGELAALMATYAPGKILQDFSPEKLPDILAALRELKTTDDIGSVPAAFTSSGRAVEQISQREVDETANLFEVPSDFSKPGKPQSAPVAGNGSSPPPESPLAIATPVSTGIGLDPGFGYLAHGPALPENTRPIPIKPLRDSNAFAEKLDLKIVTLGSAEALAEARRKFASD